MKTTLLLLVVTASILVNGVLRTELNYTSTMNGTAVIAAKTQIKGPDQRAMILPPNLTKKQADLLLFAYDTAKADGISHPEYFQGLLYQESKVGGMKNYKVAGQEFGLKPMERYYGVPQIKLIAAKEVLKYYPELGKFSTDEEIIAKLITDDRWAIQMGSKYFLLMSKGRSIQEALVAYNKGPTGASGINPFADQYATSVSSHVQSVIKSANNSRARDIKLAALESKNTVKQ